MPARSSCSVSFPVLDDDDEASLARRILVEEHEAYPQAVQLLLDGRWRVDGRRVVGESSRQA
jgi:folate-dependent phosphoribosylglycinamide formyltransferase PurN